MPEHQNIEKMNNKSLKNQNNLFFDIKTLIEQSKQQIAVAVNSAMTMLYWQVGKRIAIELQDKDRSEIYGKEVVANLCKDLSDELW